MPFVQTPAPPAALKALVEMLPHIAASAETSGFMPEVRESLQAAARSASPSKPNLSVPVYVLGLDEIHDGRRTTSSKPVLWTHVFSTEGAQGGSMLSADTALDTPNVTALSQRPEGGAFWQTFDALRTMPDVSRSDYELAELRVPAMRVDAFLLRGRVPATELVVPFRSQQKDVEVGRSYPISTFMELLKPAADALLAQQGDGKGG